MLLFFFHFSSAFLFDYHLNIVQRYFFFILFFNVLLLHFGKRKKIPTKTHFFSCINRLRCALCLPVYVVMPVSCQCLMIVFLHFWLFWKFFMFNKMCTSLSYNSIQSDCFSDKRYRLHIYLVFLITILLVNIILDTSAMWSF